MRTVTRAPQGVTPPSWTCHNPTFPSSDPLLHAIEAARRLTRTPHAFEPCEPAPTMTTESAQPSATAVRCVVITSALYAPLDSARRIERSRCAVRETQERRRSRCRPSPPTAIIAPCPRPRTRDCLSIRQPRSTTRFVRATQQQYSTTSSICSRHVRTSSRSAPVPPGNARPASSRRGRPRGRDRTRDGGQAQGQPALGRTPGDRRRL